MQRHHRPPNGDQPCRSADGTKRKGQQIAQNEQERFRTPTLFATSTFTDGNPDNATQQQGKRAELSAGPALEAVQKDGRHLSQQEPEHRSAKSESGQKTSSGSRRHQGVPSAGGHEMQGVHSGVSSELNFADRSAGRKCCDFCGGTGKNCGESRRVLIESMCLHCSGMAENHHSTFRNATR